MTKENAIEFTRRGELTNFPFGTDLKTIKDRLGDNSGWTVPISRRDMRPALIKYDQTELYFNDQDDQKLYGVQVTYSKPADKKELEMDYCDLKEIWIMMKQRVF